MFLLVDAHHHGLLTAQIFFSLWLLPLRYLAYTFGWFPRTLGGVIVVGGACYLLDLLAAFLVPDANQRIHAFIVISAAIAEIWTVGYLLTIGVKAARPTRRNVIPRHALALVRDVANHRQLRSMTWSCRGCRAPHALPRGSRGR